jgi:hypothetical protein
MGEKKLLSIRELKLMKLKAVVGEKTQEPVFIKKEIISILKALGCTCVENWAKSLKNGKRLSEFGISNSDFHDNKFYVLSDVWELLVKLDRAGKINLSAAGLNNIENLAVFEIPLYQKEPEPNVGFSRNTRYEERNLYSQGFWENGIKAMEG